MQCLVEGFSLIEVSYTIVRLSQASSLITLRTGEKIEPVGAERQWLTLVLSSVDRCRVKIERRWMAMSPIWRVQTTTCLSLTLMQLLYRNSWSSRDSRSRFAKRVQYDTTYAEPILNAVLHDNCTYCTLLRVEVKTLWPREPLSLTFTACVDYQLLVGSRQAPYHDR
jgi:hypothetical protein